MPTRAWLSKSQVSGTCFEMLLPLHGRRDFKSPMPVPGRRANFTGPWQRRATRATRLQFRPGFSITSQSLFFQVQSLPRKALIAALSMAPLVTHFTWQHLTPSRTRNQNRVRATRTDGASSAKLTNAKPRDTPVVRSSFSSTCRLKAREGELMAFC